MDEEEDKDEDEVEVEVAVAEGKPVVDPGEALLVCSPGRVVELVESLDEVEVAVGSGKMGVRVLDEEEELHGVGEPVQGVGRFLRRATHVRVGSNGTRMPLMMLPRKDEMPSTMEKTWVSPSLITVTSASPLGSEADQFKAPSLRARDSRRSSGRG